MATIASTSASAFRRLRSLRLQPEPDLSPFTDNVPNYVGVPSTATTALRGRLRRGSQIIPFSPLFLVNTIEDPMPYSQFADMFMHLDALGVTNYKVVCLTGAGHSFDNWARVKDQALAFPRRRFRRRAAAAAFPSPSPGDFTKKLLNVSTRAYVGTDYNVMVGGFIYWQTDKRVVLRALGPSLSQSVCLASIQRPCPGSLRSTGVLMESNDNRLALAGIQIPCCLRILRNRSLPRFCRPGVTPPSSTEL